MADGFDPAALPVRDLRRLVGEMWKDPRCDRHAGKVLEAAVGRGRRSLDRALITAWLGMGREDHPARARLGHALRLVVGRHDWAWAERGARWHLWDDEEGPRQLARALQDTDTPLAVLQAAGLEGDLRHGAFLRRGLRVLCAWVQGTQGPEAETQGARLIALFSQIPAAGLAGPVVMALLHPWRAATPSDAYRRVLLDHLVQAYGDPRVEDVKWAQIVREGGARDGDALVAIMRRWLTERSFRQFFDVVGRTTNDPEQWADRRAFWQGYLDRGAVTDAWFALGRDAEDFIRRRVKIERHEYARIAGSTADPSHSALVIAMGSLIIAEWSHNGACRFWRVADRKAPKLYRKEYFDVTLRAMDGGAGFERLSHTSSWQWRFARKIHSEVMVAHPTFGEGLRV